MSERSKALQRIKEKELGKLFVELLIAKLELDIQVFETAVEVTPHVMDMNGWGVLFELISAPDAIILEAADQVEIEVQIQ